MRLVTAILMAAGFIGAAAAADPYLVKEIAPQATDMSTMVAHQGRVYFAYDDGVHGSELWCSDGSDAGTFMVKDIIEGTTGSTPLSITSFANRVFFIAKDRDLDYQLWSSDGTAAGTMIATPVVSPPLDLYHADRSWCFRAGNCLYFDASLPNGPYLFAMAEDNLTTAIAVQNYFTANMVTSPLKTITDWNGKLCLAGNIIFDFDINPWISDGTLLGTDPIVDLSGSGIYYPYMFTPVGDKMYFALGNPTYPSLYVTDGTGAGTISLHYFDEPNILSQIFDLNGVAVLRVGNWIWVSSGTEWTTRRLPNTMTGVNFLLPMGGTIFMAAGNATYGNELWQTDGTYAGTKFFKDLNPSGDSAPHDPVIFNNRLYFVASDGVHGNELWSTDGTTQSTHMVYDIRSGDADSSPSAATVCGRTLYFTADDGVHGRCLWALPLDMTDAVDIPAGDSAPISSASTGMSVDFASNSVPGQLSIVQTDEAAPGRTGDPIGYWQLSGLPGSTFSATFTFTYAPVVIAAAGLGESGIGLIHSTDGGQTWTEILTVINPANHTLRTTLPQSSLGLFAISSSVNSVSEVWVDFGWSGIEAGTAEQPLNTLLEAITCSLAGGNVLIYTGASAEAMRITKPLRIEAVGGLVRIGAN